MGWTWQSLLDAFLETANADYRSEVDRNDAMAEMVERVLYAMLEKMRDEHGEM